MTSRFFLFLMCLLAPVIASPKAFNLIESNASIYLLGDLSTGLIISEKNPSRDINSTSLTKLMTLYLIFDAVKNGILNAQGKIKVSRTAATTRGVRMFLNEGDSVKIEDLLKGVVIYGANDAALALVEEIAGTEAQFIVAMNQKAKVLGLSQLRFTDAIGESPNMSPTSASDLYQLAASIILDHAPSYALFKLNQHEWQGITQYSSNSLLGRDSYNDGLMVSRSASGGTIGIISSVRDGRRVLLVIADNSSKGQFASKAQDLLNQAFKKFTTVHIAEPNTPIAQLTVGHGVNEVLDIGSTDKISVTIPRERKNEIEVVIESVQPLIAPIKYGDVVAKLTVKLKTDTIQTSELVALKHIRRAGVMVRGWKRLKSLTLHLLEFMKNN